MMLFLALTAALSATPAPSVEALRNEARALIRVQGTLDWYTRTQGEPSIAAETYEGHTALFSAASIRAVAKAIENPKLSADEKRALQYFKSYLAVEHLSQATAQFADERSNAELKATVKLSWSPSPVLYKELENLAKAEKEASRRSEIEQARAEVWRKTLNPILERREVELQRRAKALGYKSYVALSEESRLVKLAPLIAEGPDLFAATEKYYPTLLAELSQKELGLPVEKVRRSDMPRLRNSPRFEKYFPRQLLKPAFLELLSGLGLTMKTVAGTEIRIDDAPHPLKEQRAACYNLHVPDDIRITVKPTDGLEDFATFFHEGGHALHYANTTTQVFEFQQLGSAALTEGLAELFGKVWNHPAWLKRYRAFVTRYNQSHKTSFPTMTDADIAELVRVRVFNDLYFLRRYGYAKLPYEAALHGGEPAMYLPVYPKRATDLMAMYSALFGKAYGLPMEEADALRFRTDVDETFYAADYARAFALASLVDAGLAERFGADWFANPAAGAALKEIFADGNKLSPDEVAQRFGHPRLTYQPALAQIARAMEGR